MDRQANIFVSFIMPVYNEALCLDANVSKLINYFHSLDRSWELILVDDGSADSSLNICKVHSRKHPRVRSVASSVNRGKGNAVRKGMLGAEGMYRIFMDADLAVPVDYIGDCLSLLEQGADVAIGSRHLPGAKIRVHEEPLRRMLGEAYRRWIICSLGLNVSDITCGLKGFSAKAAKDVFCRSRIERWGYDAEILFLAGRLGYSIKEHPVNWFHSFDSDVRVFRDSVRTFVEMIQIYHRFINGGYGLSYRNRSRG